MVQYPKCAYCPYCKLNRISILVEVSFYISEYSYALDMFQNACKMIIGVYLVLSLLFPFTTADFDQSVCVPSNTAGNIFFSITSIILEFVIHVFKYFFFKSLHLLKMLLIIFSD